MKQQFTENVNLSISGLKKPYICPNVEIFELESDGFVLADSGGINTSSVLPTINDDGSGSFDE